MALLELSLASKEDSLSVRRFAVHEAISSLFEISIMALSPNEDLDLESIVGGPFALRIVGASQGTRRWTGVCSFMEQEQAEETGLSTYHVRLVPALWLLTQRCNHRIFQHLSAPEIVGALLNEWEIEASWHIHEASHPRLEYRVQYGESDYVFLARLLEEAGISFAFADDVERGSVLHLFDAPHASEPRAGGPIRYVDQPSRAYGRQFVTAVKVSQEVRPGKVTLRAHDFRRRTGFALVGDASIKPPLGGEERLEQVHYEHGAFVVEGHKRGETPVADDKGVARADERVAKARAERHLAGERASRRGVTFRTNILDLRPGVVFSIGNHSRSDLGGDAKLLATELSIDGAHDGEWTTSGRAVFAASPYYPPKTMERPRIHGVESAIVVGPKGQDIHTDEFGRVRVQFHWDREGDYDERSSCWMRVSQGWAGGGFGMMMIPRVGQEVLVGFLGGDPDQPVVVGRVFNNTTQVPYKLPEHKTRSSWKSDSSPGSGGFNEIMFEDAQGAELVYVQAERNLNKLVKVDETIRIGHSRDKRVGVDETIDIGKDRTATVGAVDEALVGERHTVAMRQAKNAAVPPTEIEMVDRRISLTTGEATITLEGPNITLEAAASILMKAGADVALAAGSNVTVNAPVNMTLLSGATLVVQSADGDVVIQGGPRVRINPEDLRWRRAGKKPRELPVEAPPDADLASELEEAEDHEFFDPEEPDWFQDKLRSRDWDFAAGGEPYREFASFVIAAAGRALGLPEGVILRQAGMRKKERGEWKPENGDPGNGLWGGAAPFGMEPPELEAMRKGFTFFDKHRG
jgi:type VI secretion system secreted protein VgrG